MIIKDGDVGDWRWRCCWLKMVMLLTEDGDVGDWRWRSCWLKMVMLVTEDGDVGDWRWWCWWLKMVMLVIEDGDVGHWRWPRLGPYVQTFLTNSLSQDYSNLEDLPSTRRDNPRFEPISLVGKVTWVFLTFFHNTWPDEGPIAWSVVNRNT